MNEFELIKRFCSYQTTQRDDVIIDSGDDCAILSLPPHQHLAVTTDTLVAGVHFPLETSAFDIGHKVLAVNLSDLAAMGATPAWVTMALTIPSIEEDWLTEFAKGFFALGSRYDVQLVGGDLTRGPLTITVQAQGFVPRNQAISRAGAKEGDLIYVTQTLGDAGVGLSLLTEALDIPSSDRDYFLTRLNRPEPRITPGEKLRGIAHAAIDISDGLAADLTHLLEKSQVGAIVYVDQLPLSPAMRKNISLEKAISFALQAGDDYELCFTLPRTHEKLLQDRMQNGEITCTCIGEIIATPGLNLQFQDGRPYYGDNQGYQHF